MPEPAKKPPGLSLQHPSVTTLLEFARIVYRIGLGADFAADDADGFLIRLERVALAHEHREHALRVALDRLRFELHRRRRFGRFDRQRDRLGREALVLPL